MFTREQAKAKLHAVETKIERLEETAARLRNTIDEVDETRFDATEFQNLFGRKHSKLDDKFWWKLEDALDSLYEGKAICDKQIKLERNKVEVLGSYLTRFESQASPVEVTDDANRDFDETRIDFPDGEARLNYLSELKPFKAEFVAALHGIYLDTAGYCEEEILPAVDWAELMAPLYVTDHSTTAYRKNADGTFTEDAAAYESLREVELKMFKFSHPELYNVQADADELKPDYDEKRWAVDFDIYHADSDLTDAQLQDFTNRLHEAMTANGNRASVELEDCVIGIFGDDGGDNDSDDKIIAEMQSRGCWVEYPEDDEDTAE